LTDEQYSRLSSIGMVWEIDDSWSAYYEKAKAFYKERGNLDIPADYETKDGLKLGRWYRMRLQEYKNGILPDEKSKLLEEIGIQKESVVKRNWERNYACARHFFEKNGNLAVDSDYVTEEGIKLGIWLSSQREKYKLGTLSEEQVNALEYIGIQWNRFDSKWDSFYELAKIYFRENGNLLVPANYETADGVKLGSWVATQRNKYKNNKLSEIQIERLEKLSIVWNVSDIAWEEGYCHAKEYRKNNGNLNVKNGYVCKDGFKLYSWVQNKRTAYKKGKLSSERIALLEALGIKWENEKTNVRSSPAEQPVFA
jgi:hypothetical protein